MSEIHTFVVDEQHNGQRLDQYIAYTSLVESRSQLKQRLLSVEVNGKKENLSYRLSTGDLVLFSIAEPVIPNLRAEKQTMDILFENDDVLVINKAGGQVVHPGAGRPSGTLANALMHHIQSQGGRLTATQQLERPGIVHRLDKDTTGVLIFAKNVTAHTMLARQFKDKTVGKCYLAILKGRPHCAAGKIVSCIRRNPRKRSTFMVDSSRGRKAETKYRILHFFNDNSLVALFPATGRTHQLRVHMQYLGCPVLGDPLYTSLDKRFSGLPMMLHAYELSICIPPSGERMLFKAGIPLHFLSCLQQLGYTLELPSSIL